MFDKWRILVTTIYFQRAIVPQLRIINRKHLFLFSLRSGSAKTVKIPYLTIKYEQNNAKLNHNCQISIVEFCILNGHWCLHCLEYHDYKEASWTPKQRYLFWPLYLEFLNIPKFFFLGPFEFKITRLDCALNWTSVLLECNSEDKLHIRKKSFKNYFLA